jgi:hypothetical protein
MTANNGRGSNQEHKRKINDPLPRSCTPRNVTSLAGSGPTSTSFCSTTDPKHIVEKLHVRNYKNLNHQLAFESKYSNSLSRDIPLKVIGGLKGKGIDSRKNLKLNLNH